MKVYIVFLLYDDGENIFESIRAIYSTYEKAVKETDKLKTQCFKPESFVIREENVL